MLGFSNFDIALLIFCPIGAVIGSLVSAIIFTISPDGPPQEEGKNYFASDELSRARGMWLFLRMFIGGVLGFVLGLYFVGAMHETPSTFAKIFALSIVVGYAAPKLWVAQEKALIKKIEHDVKIE